MAVRNYPVGREPDVLEKIFRYFGEVETPRLNSRVYTDLSLGVAGDPELLEMTSVVMPSQPPPNVLYAAVKDLLLENPARSDSAAALARFYPSISGLSIPDESAWPAFRAFCLEHAEDLKPLLESGRTQTCVVHRSAVVLPALASLERLREAEGRVGLLEIGPSVGLNLRLDHYRYVYASSTAHVDWGEGTATPVLECEIRGTTPPPVPERLEVVARHGLELAPIDLEDPKALRWLRALIWPEHVERARRMDEALEVAARVPVEIFAGDATQDIEAAIARLPSDAPRVVFATHALYQIRRKGIEAIFRGIARASREQPVDFVNMESNGQGHSRVDWTRFEAGEQRRTVELAEADSHGRWLNWGGT